MSVARTRIVLVAFGVLFVVAGVAFGQAQASEAVVPWLWMPLYVAAGIACWVFAWKLESPGWWQTSRILAVLAIATRVYGVVGLVTKGGANAWRGTGVTCLYVIGALALYYVWTAPFRFWSQHVAATGR